MLAAAKGGRFVAVGDRNQAINGFAGADCESFDKIARLPNTIELPLSVNYRCGSNIVSLAQEIVPQIQPHSGAIEGEIKSINKLAKNLFTPNTMVICRTSAPLVGMCCKLLQNGITAVVKGKDIGASLKSLIDGCKSNRIDSLMKYLDTTKEKVLKSVIRDGKGKLSEDDAKQTPRYAAICDKVACIENLLITAKSVNELKTTIDSLFTEENVKNAVVFSTVHKSKGLESDKVVILLPNKLPLRWKGQQDWQFEQERNLQYVAYTRAKKELVFVDIEDKALMSQNIEND
jgi:superfamily I DNA/RNA helicase